MDANISRQIAFKPTGVQLLVSASLLLSLSAIAFDVTTGRWSHPWQSASLPLLTSAIAAAVAGALTLPVLRRLKAGQVIREDGPQSHLKKAGTPTMGGIFFVPTGVLAALIWSQFDPEAIAVGAVTLAYAAIGWSDDWQILLKKSNKGITPRQKLALQAAIGALFCLWLAWAQPASITTLNLPFNLNLPLGWLFFPLALFVFAAESNATNLTDGIDGLAGGTCAIAFLGLGAIATPTHPGLATFCFCLSGSCLGFVVHNRNPAKVFMGDTGSLALGAALAGVGILSQQLWALFVVSGIFFLESLSVIAQVSYYKATKGPDGVGKRLLKMAPFHHHLELSGWSETQIVGSFYAIAVVLVVLAWLSRNSF